MLLLSLLLPLLVVGGPTAPTRKKEKHTTPGNMLHLTDFHIDPHYEEGASIADKCHRRGKLHHKDSLVAGRYGAPASGCDSPPILVNHTFSFIKT